METKPAVLCIVGALFGRPFFVEAKRLGWRVDLLTEERYLKEEWNRDYIDNVYAVPDLYDEKVVRNVVCFLSRETKYDKIVGLGEFDIEVAADLREHTRTAGMGDTTARYFRDKLAMREKALQEGLPVPDFTRIINNAEIKKYMDSVEPTWIFKPRMGASSAKIQKFNYQEEVWSKIEELGDKRTSYLLEKYIPGDVYHVDSLVYDYKPVFDSVSKYGATMLDINTNGGVFTTFNIDKKSDDYKKLSKLNAKLTKAFGLKSGTMHNEYIKSHATGEFYFLECSARIGGARIPDIVWHNTGLCLWHEWAKIELLPQGTYTVPDYNKFSYGGGIFTMSNIDFPDMSTYTDPEIKWVQKKKNFAGLIISAESSQRVQELLQTYHHRFANEFMTHIPQKP